MIRPSRILLGAAILISHPLQAQEPPSGADRWNQAAVEWVSLLQKGDFDAAAARVDPAVPPGAMDAPRLRAVWEQLAGQLGDLLFLEPGPVMEQDGYQIVDLRGTFQAQVLTVRVVFNDALEVSGFFLRPLEGGGGSPRG